ncbi:Tn3 family transposase [Streptomyces sp. NPDC057908]|uniref:Tn3 family transposase n=1 Tax=Streptomyces sp. NPDC057908 TaxID=3346276 RepID=UPI0036EAD748
MTNRHGEPWISVPKLDEPTSLQALKNEVVPRWGELGLLDVLKNANFLTGFTDEFASVAAYERIDRAVLQRRLLFALFTLGTNMGIRAIVATGEHGETEAALRHVRRRFFTIDDLRAAVRKLVYATFAARDTTWWARAPRAPPTRRSSAPGAMGSDTTAATPGVRPWSRVTTGRWPSESESTWDGDPDGQALGPTAQTSLRAQDPLAQESDQMSCAGEL